MVQRALPPILLAAVLLGSGCQGAVPAAPAAAAPAAGTASAGTTLAAPVTSGSGAAVSPPAPTAPGAPRLFYTDLVSGPNAGGENGQGVYVSLYGRGFGASRGTATVTVGGGAVASYPIWTDAKITVQLGPLAATGSIVVHGALGDSDGLPFTVRAGTIAFVATNGDDTASGSFAAPWKTLSHAVDTVAAGDTVYARDGVTQAVEHAYSAALSISTDGTQAAPIALVAYPGAKVTVGSPTLMGIRIPNVGVSGSYWVIAGLTIVAQDTAISLGGNGALGWRIVANDCSAPAGTGLTGCVETSAAQYVSFLGNEVHDSGAGGTKFYHAVYFSTDTNHVECAWNDIHDNRTCRAIQFHSSPLGGATGFNQFDLSCHDNVIHGTIGDGINFATVDPSQGKVEAYNNVIYHVGTGPDPADGATDYACVYVAGTTNNGADGTGTVEVYNNTCYDFGGLTTSSDAGCFSRSSASPGIVLHLVNNIVYARNGEAYVAGSSDTSLMTGSNNLFFGNGPGPSFLAGNVNADPLFTSLATFDFSLTATSPTVDAGLTTAALWDVAGVPRPQGSGWDIGAYELPK
jgi:hypothetical protein